MLNDILSNSRFQRLKPLPTGIQPSGRVTHPLKCLLFDVYGTLLISGSGEIGTTIQDIHSDNRLAQLLRKFGINRPPITVLDDFGTAINQRHRRLKAIGIDYPEVEIDQIWMKVLDWHDKKAARRFALAFELISNPVYPMPGLKQLIGKSREDCILGMISNAQFYTPMLFERLLNASLEEIGFEKDLLIFSFQTEYAKPSEHLFNLAKNRLEKQGIDPDKTLYVGNDMLNDIMPAQKIGFKTALFAGDRRSLRLRQDDARCQGVKPDIVITELSQLIDYM